MKKGIFIKHPTKQNPSYEHAWKHRAYYNSKDIPLEPGEGIVLIRKDFSPVLKTGSVKKDIAGVTLRAAALGMFDLFLNGERIGTNENGTTVYDELKPGWTDYRFRTFEFEYDVTGLVKKNNTFVALVSPGWWSGRISFGFYGFRPCGFCGEIEINYKDGTSEIIASDTDWQTSVGGPILTADIWNGEYYDSRIPHPAKEPDAHEWINAVAFNDFAEGSDGAIALVPLADRIRAKTALERRPLSATVHSGTVKNGSDFGKIKVISCKVGDGCEVTVLKKGQRIILDMGQNMVGKPEITIHAARGTKIECCFAEFLNDTGIESRGNDGPEGSMYMKNYRTALARAVYVASGKKSETYTPTHAFYGFRYVELNADANIRIFGVRGIVLGSEMKETASFECDNAEVNKLWSNVVWGMRGNYLSIPTDCPQRDERLGWTGDTQIFVGAGSYLANVDNFLSKWLTDASDSQRGFEGAYCDVIPRVFPGHNANAAWGDAGLVVPYRLWLMYNDTDIVARQYDSMEYYMQHLERYGLEGPNTAYGDWLNYDVTDKRYIAVCYYKHDADLMVKFSEILGKTDRAEYYRGLSDKIKAHFAEKYTTDGKLNSDMTTQTCYLLALAFNMLADESRAEAIKALEKKIKDNDCTLSTGFVGTGILNQTLSEVGLDGVAYSLLLCTRDPSWLYSVKQGATTVWERWNSYTLEKGFGNVGMNSFNHYAYGAVAEWLMASVAGIRPDAECPGFKHFILAPVPDSREDGEIPAGQDRIRFVKASFDSPEGLIKSEWEFIDGKPVYKFTVPAGTGATVTLPFKGLTAKSTVTLNGIKFVASKLGTVSDGNITFEVTAGTYEVL